MPSVFSGAKLMYGAARDVRGTEVQERPLFLCGRKEPLEELRLALGAEGPQGERAAQLFAVRKLTNDDAARLSRGSVVVYGGEVVSGLDDGTRNDLKVIGRARIRKLALLEALDLPSPAVTEAGRIRGLEPADLLPYRRGHFPVAHAMRELAGRAGDSGPWLASLLPAFRPYVVDELIESAARRNARTSLMIFIPGADLPILTSMQMRMVLKIAACHGQKISPDRALELLTVLGAGFGFRMVARELLDFVPIAGWAVQSGVAYSGTKALGKAADEYFERGAVADASKLRALAEGVAVEMRERFAKLRG
jgi:uncharacterized protein (DUF697 family)